MSLYDILGVPTDADARTIHAAYRRAAKTTHPDQGGDRAAWDRLRLAHDVLTDEERRAAYDRDGTTKEPEVDRDFEEATGWVARALDDVIAKSEGQYHRVDVVARVRTTLAQWETEHYQADVKIATNQEVLRQIAARLSDKGDRPVMGGIFDAKIRGYDDMKVKAQRGIAMLKLAKTLVSGASYRWEPQVMTGYTNTGWLLGQAAGQQNAGMVNPFINSLGSFP